MNNSIQTFIKKNSYTRKVIILNNDRIPVNNFDAAVVIPAFAENNFIDSTLHSLSKSVAATSRNILISIIVNNPPLNSNIPNLQQYIDDNCILLKRLKSEFKNFGNKNFCLSLIDASSNGLEIPAKHGVGGARKIACNCILPFLNWNTNPLIFFLDADTIVPENYIAAGFNFFNINENICGGYFKFKHSLGNTPDAEQAIRLYEQYLQHFVDGLKYAGSPYAYHAVGSTIVCPAEKYIKSGGMRPKQAGEDFYFLQALCKIGSAPLPIKEIQNCCITPSSRCSFRVPFGTGAKMNELVPKMQYTKEALFYNNQIFEYLKLTIDSIEDECLINAPEKWLNKLPVPVKEYFKTKNFLMNWKNILKNTPNNKQKILWAFHIWFDAFKILKFMHFCEKSPFNLKKSLIYKPITAIK
jgi:hypothetical protein